MDKVCFKCHQLLPLSSFYKHKKMADGHLNKCKACAKIDVAVNRLCKIEYYRQHDIDRSKKPERKKKMYIRSVLFRQKNPKKYKAHTAVGNAIRDKRLIKPEICDICGNKTKLHAHHENYDDPLLVVWLCVACHSQVGRATI
jgi:hypothetical protein